MPINSLNCEENLNVEIWLWKIEESFKVAKSEIESRPVYLLRKDRINVFKLEFPQFYPRPEILSFSNKISLRLSRPDKKFTADITYACWIPAAVFSRIS